MKCAVASCGALSDAMDTAVELDDWQLISTMGSLLLWLHLLVRGEPWALLPAGLLFLHLAERINLIHPSLLPPFVHHR